MEPNDRKETRDTPVQIRDTRALGAIIRATRQRSASDQSTAAGLVGVGVRFLGDLERGKPNVRLGLVLQVLERLGLTVWIAPRGWRPDSR